VLHARCTNAPSPRKSSKRCVRISTIEVSVPKQDSSTLRLQRHTLMVSPEPNDPHVSKLQLQSARTRLHPPDPVTFGLRAMQPPPQLRIF
jgi:hypothetical protein